MPVRKVTSRSDLVILQTFRSLSEASDTPPKLTLVNIHTSTVAELVSSIST